MVEGHGFAVGYAGSDGGAFAWWADVVVCAVDGEHGDGDGGEVFADVVGAECAADGDVGAEVGLPQVLEKCLGLGWVFVDESGREPAFAAERDHDLGSVGGSCLCAFFPGFGFSDFRCRAHDCDRGEAFGVVEGEFHRYPAGDGDPGEVDASLRGLVGDECGGCVCEFLDAVGICAGGRSGVAGEVVPDHFEIIGEVLRGGVPQFFHARSDAGPDEQQRLVRGWLGKALCCEVWGHHGWLPFVVWLGLVMLWRSMRSLL